ncbi:hypothetical protein D0Z03_000491 [Geotrichum reessii]|nr:hypothetical protein D0Z03_000491 [Galactomyces reessii]
MSSNDSNSQAAAAPESSTLRLIPAKDLTPAEEVQAFKLITDAQAQVQNLFNNHVLFHPLTIGSYVLVLAVVAHWFWPDYGRLLISTCGISIAWLSLVGRLNEREVSAAESMQVEDYFEQPASSSSNSKDEKKIKKKNDNKADKKTDDENTAAGGKFYSFAYVYNSLVVGTITARVFQSDSAAPEIKILGWSTLKRYRNTGLGCDLLTLLIKTVKEEYKPLDNATSGVEITAETVTGHNSAEKLLRQAGFKRVRATPLAGIRGSIYGIESHEWTLTL